MSYHKFSLPAAAGKVGSLFFHDFSIFSKNTGIFGITYDSGGIISHCTTNCSYPRGNHSWKHFVLCERLCNTSYNNNETNITEGERKIYTTILKERRVTLVKRANLRNY